MKKIFLVLTCAAAFCNAAEPQYGVLIQIFKMIDPATKSYDLDIYVVNRQSIRPLFNHITCNCGNRNIIRFDMFLKEADSSPERPSNNISIKISKKPGTTSFKYSFKDKNGESISFEQLPSIVDLPNQLESVNMWIPVDGNHAQFLQTVQQTLQPFKYTEKKVK